MAKSLQAVVTEELQRAELVSHGPRRSRDTADHVVRAWTIYDGL